MQISEGLPQRSFRRRDGAMHGLPGLQLVDDGTTVLTASGTTALGRVARECRLALDHEEASDDADTLEGESVAKARGVYEATAAMTPTSRTPAPRTFEKVQDIGPVALHVARDCVAQEASHAL